MISKSEANRIIDESVKAEWFLLAKRSDIPPLPVWYKIKYSFKNREFQKIFGTSVPWACFWRGNNTELFLRGKKYRTAIRNATKLLYSKKKFKRHLEKLERYCFTAKKAATILERSNWEKMEDEKLSKLYLSTVEKYVQSFVYGFITWCVQVLHEDARKILERYAQNLKEIGISPEQALSILIVPEEVTAYQKKELAIEKLSKKYRKLYSGRKGQKFIEKNNPELHEQMKKFIKEYGWVGFGYVGPSMTHGDLTKELTRSFGKKSESLAKKDVYKTCGFNAAEKNVFYVLEKISHTKDLRNSTDDYVHYCFSNFYQEIAKRKNLREDDVHFLWDEELSNLILGKRKISEAYIRKKKIFCAAFSGYKKLKLKQYYLGNEGKKILGKVRKYSDRSAKKESTGLLKGVIASAGFAKGRVRIMLSAGEAGKVKKGDILVTTMTSPKFLPAIHNTGAIITDDGGLTNHAAIIARELKKPCIVGTKIATKVLKDGDWVEVDANKGNVRIIKRFEKKKL